MGRRSVNQYRQMVTIADLDEKGCVAVVAGHDAPVLAEWAGVQWGTRNFVSTLESNRLAFTRKSQRRQGAVILVFPHSCENYA